MELSSRSAAAPQPAPRPTLVPAPAPAPHPSRRKLWIVAVAAVLAIGGYFAFDYARSARSTSAETGPAVGVPTAAVSFGDVRSTLRLTGSIAAEKSVTLLAPRIQGSRNDFNRGGPGGGGGLDFNLVLLHLAKPGTIVKPGDVVAEFDTQNQLQRLDDYKDTVVQLQATIRKTEADLAASLEAKQQAARSAKADWDKAKLDLQTEKVISAIDAEKNRLTVEQDELAYNEQLSQITEFEKSQEAALRSSQFNLGQAKLELQRAQGNIERMTVRAPIQGMVVLSNIVMNNETRQVREGDQIFAGQPFVSVVDPRSMILNATVNQVDAERLRLGMKANVTLDAWPELHMPASLQGIGAMSVASTFRAGYVGTIPIRLKIDGSDSRLIPDLTGSADVTLDVEPHVTVAPRAAILADEGGSYVYVKTPEGWQRHKVDLGLASFTDVAVHSGLQKGDIVALGRAI